MNLSKLEN